jgi:formylglycine-generating enzyme required for sulfatase activity
MIRKIRRIFVSYSRRNETWAYSFHGELRKSYDAWIDAHIVGASNWWTSILEEIEECDVFIAIMSKPYMESPYCFAELQYAEAWNKPIVPLMIEECDYPSSLGAKNIQFTKMSMRQDIRDTMNQVLHIFVNVQAEIYSGRFNPPLTKSPRPDRPIAISPNQAQATFELAQKAEQQGAYPLAEELYTEALKVDPQGMGMLALEAIKRIAVLAQQPQPSVGGQRAAPRSPASTPIISTPPKIITSAEILPAPFAWVEIPKKGYSIAKYPVTNAQFAKFIEAGGYKKEQWWTKQGWETRQKEKWTEPRYWTDKKWNGAEQPVVGVSWYEAVAFCLWLSDVTNEKIMLPTEDQWQYAVQGDDGRDYPWGKKWNGDLCNNNVDSKGIRKTTPVTQYEGKGDSPFGVVDMAGNVWEWCLTDYNEKTNDVNSNANRRVLRGGSWYGLNADGFRCDYRSWFYPFSRNYNWGFRASRS